jgi:hypothetical protein
MDPISGVVEKKFFESLFDSVRKRWNRYSDLERKNAALEAQLAEIQSGKLAFERKVAELDCRPEDDGIYWTKDGRALCSLCLESDQKFIQLTHGAREGTYYCKLHEHHFETAASRHRRRNVTPMPIKHHGPHSWMR